MELLRFGKTAFAEKYPEIAVRFTLEENVRSKAYLIGQTLPA